MANRTHMRIESVDVGAPVDGRAAGIVVLAEPAGVTLHMDVSWPTNPMGRPEGAPRIERLEIRALDGYIDYRLLRAIALDTALRAFASASVALMPGSHPLDRADWAASLEVIAA